MKLKIRITTLLFFCMGGMVTSQTTRYVSTTGNNANPGTFGSPYLSPVYAATQCEEGDTIEIMGGTYMLSGIIRLTHNHMTIRSRAGEWAILQAPVNDINIDYPIYIQEPGMHHINIERLEIVGGYYYGIKTESDFDNRIPGYPNIGTTDITIKNCRIHDTGRDCIKITPASNRVHILNCEIYNSGVGPSNISAQNAEGIDNVNGDEMFVYGCYIHDIFSNGMYAKGGAANCIIENNLIVDCGEGGALLGYWDTDEEWFDTLGVPENLKYQESVNSTIKNNIILNCNYEGIGLYGVYLSKVYNNTVVNCAINEHAALFIGQGSIYNSLGEINPPSRDFIVQNNIFQVNTSSMRYAVEVREQNGAMLAGTNTLGYNRYYQGGSPILFSWYGTDYDFSNWQTNAGFDQTGSVTGDPDLNADFHLNASSPCIDAGINTSAVVVVDYDGDVRTAMVDMGADEYNSMSYLPVPPGAGVIGTGIGSYETVISVETYLDDHVAKVYPTLVIDQVYIELADLNQDDFRLVDMLGNVIMQGRIEKSDLLNLSNLKNGMYILQFSRIKQPYYLIKQ
jgi:parallel beta-helix repeat protein